MTAVTADLAVEEDLDRSARNPFDALLARLSHQSVVKHFDAYGDIDWDGAELALDPEDPRWELSSDDSLGATSWYAALPQTTRARLGLDLVVSKMKTGLEFESVLKRGLLEYASTLPNGSPGVRYAAPQGVQEGPPPPIFPG